MVSQIFIGGALTLLAASVMRPTDCPSVRLSVLSYARLQNDPKPARCRGRYIGRRRGVVVRGVRRMNEVNARRARLVPGWVTVFGRVYHLGICNVPAADSPDYLPTLLSTPGFYFLVFFVTSQLGQLSLASLRGRLIEYQLRLG